MYTYEIIVDTYTLENKSYKNIPFSKECHLPSEIMPVLIHIIILIEKSLKLTNNNSVRKYGVYKHLFINNAWS